MDAVAFRRLMPVTERWIFLDHAAVAPLPAPSRDAMTAWADGMARDGVLAVSGWMRRVEEIRQAFARLLRAEAPDVAFIKNTSEGIGIVAEGFPWKPGDNLVTSADEYPANVYPWLNLASRGVEVRRVPSRQGRVVPDDLFAAVDARTRLLTLSHVEFATGYRADLATIGSFCRERGLFFFVDAIQGLGILDLDVSSLPIDALAADSHKWLLGPEGSGVFWIRREWVERLHPVGVGWNSVVGAWEFSTIDFRLKPHAGRWESGSLNMPGIMAMGRSLDLLQEVGVPAITARIKELTDHFCETIGPSGWRVFSSRAANEWSGIVSLEAPPNADLPQTMRWLRDRGVVVNLRGGRLRLSPHLYNTIDEMDRLANLLGERR